MLTSAKQLISGGGITILVRGALAYSVSQPIISIALMILVIVPFLTFTGCTGEGAGGPVISSLSTQTATTAGQSSDPDAEHTKASQAGQLPPTSLSAAAAPVFTSDLTSPLDADGPPSRSNSSDDIPMITVTSTPRGVTVRLNWEHSPDTDTSGYYVYYGKQPAQESGSCAAYEANKTVDTPPATIAGLEHDTFYYFAVKHFNDSEDACSEEIMVATPPLTTIRQN